MTCPPWRIAHASVIGISHVTAGIPCQDASRCEVMRAPDGREVLLAVAADGAGSAARSDAGAEMAVKSFIREFAHAIGENGSLEAIDRAFVLVWLETLRKRIDFIAQDEGAPSRDFACTVLGALIGPYQAIFMQVGDGAIIVSGDEASDYSWMFWPQHGEFANQTNFILQDNLAEVLDFEIVTGTINEMAIFTDGIERLVLDFATRTVRSTWDHQHSCQVGTAYAAAPHCLRGLAPCLAQAALLDPDGSGSRLIDGHGKRSVQTSTRPVSPAFWSSFR